MELPESMTAVQKLFYHWITEREKCRVGREQNLPKPWTTDPILQSYRFCNVRREDDKVTKWIRVNWREPFDGHPNMAFAMCFARLFNLPDTLQAIGFPTTPPSMFGMWKEEVRARLHRRREDGLKLFNGAYIVSTNGRSMDKVDYLLDIVLSPIWYKLRPTKEDETLESYHAALMEFDGMGSFMAGQVIADLKYTRVLCNALDWDSWAPIGPGSRRGLNRYHGRPISAAIGTKQVLEELAVLQYAVQQRCGLALPVHDIQNCCCEYDKYVRVVTGEGKPKSLYNGKV